MPVSDDTTLFREDTFPLYKEENRLLSPPEDRKLWRADAPILQSERPLLLHPESDNPGKFIYFDREGFAHPVEQSQRGTTSIKVYTLNYGQVVVERKRKVQHFQALFAQQVAAYKKVYVETTPSSASMTEFFVEPFDALVKSTLPSAEFALLGQNMLHNFDYFFVETLSRAKDRRILRNAFEVYSQKNLEENPIQISNTEINTEENYELHLEGFEVHALKGFEEIRFSLSNQHNLHLIAGTNGTGKSALLQLLGLVLSGLQRPPTNYSWGHLERNQAQTGHVKLHLRRNGKAINFTFHLNAYNALECREHRGYYDSLRARLLVIGYGLSDAETRPAKGKYKAFAPIAPLFGDSSFLHSLAEDETFYFISEQFKQLQTLLNPFLACAYPDQTIQLKDFTREHLYFETDLGQIKDWDMPRSFRAVFGFLLDMLVRFANDQQDLSKPKDLTAVVLIDEIDYTLTTHWQRHFFPLLARTFPKIRFLVTTQNPFIIQSIPHNEVTLLCNEAGCTTGQPFAHEGKVWAWTTTQVTARLLNSVTEISPRLDQKLTEVYNLLGKKTEEIEKKESAPQLTSLVEELREALPSQSPYHKYLDSLLEKDHSGDK